jgi:pimeloyl-ACP methyl ester carboxylesterase
MEHPNQAIVLVGGWADIEKCVQDLKLALENHNFPVFYFRYKYNSKPFEGKQFESMEILAERLKSYLLDNNLNNPSSKINFVGYSQGGMLILYTLGLYPELCENVRRIVSIAAPHGGALYDIFRNFISSTYYGTKEKLLPKMGLFGQVTDLLLNLSEKQMEIFGINTRYDHFVKVIYPEIAKHVFDRVPKQHLLEIYSSTDPIAPPESSTRFRDFMETYQIQMGNHQNIANFDKVIQKTIEFLF